MNLVIACDKKIQKQVSGFNFKEHNHNVLVYINEVGSNFADRIENNLPHILIVFNGIRDKDNILFRELEHMLKLLPHLRIIFVYGKPDDNFQETKNKLISLGIYDILLTDLSNIRFKNNLMSVIDKSMNAEDIEKSIEKYESMTKPIGVETIRNYIDDDTPVDLSKSSLNEEYHNEIEQVDIPQEYIGTGNITIAISSVIVNSAGVVLTAMEIATVLKQAKETVSLFLRDETYKRFLAFHNIENANGGFTLNKLPIYPLSLYEQRKRRSRFDVIDLTNNGNMTDRERKIFEKAEIKLQMCRGTEWDIAVLQEYLNSGLPYLKEINYCFYPISQKDFLKYNKSMIQGHCKACRLRTSPNYTSPCDWNRDVYADILSRYTSIGKSKKRRW